MGVIIYNEPRGVHKRNDRLKLRAFTHTHTHTHMSKCTSCDRHTDMLAFWSAVLTFIYRGIGNTLHARGPEQVFGGSFACDLSYTRIHTYIEREHKPADRQTHAPMSASWSVNVTE